MSYALDTCTSQVCYVVHMSTVHKSICLSHHLTAAAVVPGRFAGEVRHGQQILINGCAAMRYAGHVNFVRRCNTGLLVSERLRKQSLDLNSSSSHSQRGPSLHCTTMSTVDSTPTEVSNRTGGIVS